MSAPVQTADNSVEIAARLAAEAIARRYRPDVDFDDVKAAMIARLDELIEELIPASSRGKTKGDEFWCCNPTRPDKSPDSFSINIKTGQWHDFATKDSGNILTLWCRVKGLADNTEVMFDIAKFLNVAPRSAKKPKPPLGPIVAKYDYKDLDGTLLYQVTRHDPKDFRQRRPDGRGGWIDNIRDVRHVIYRWREIVEFPDATVFFCEGEKDADRLASLGHCATTITASTIWTDDLAGALTGRDVIILEDNDDGGRTRALEAATALHGNAKTLRCVRLPGLADKVTCQTGSMPTQPTGESWLISVWGLRSG